MKKSLLATELEKLLLHFNFHLDFPENLPGWMRYPVIFNFWKEEQVAVSFGKNHIELCGMEKENCPFPGYCKTCDEIEAQMKFDEESSKKNKNKDFDIDLDNITIKNNNGEFLYDISLKYVNNSLIQKLQ